MNKQEFQQLVEEISSGDATEKEVALYNYYYNQFQRNSDWDEQALGEKSKMEKELHSTITRDLQGYDTPDKQIRRFPYRKIAAAAAIVLIAAVIGILIQRQPSVSDPSYADETLVKQDVDPGTDKAVLTLADGTVVNLDDSQSGLLVDQGDVQVEKMEGGQIAYTADTDLHGAEPVYNTIRIPRGGKYQLVLADGTKVWLNSSTSLQFPVAFQGESRVVLLEGEAYFEVTSCYNKDGVTRQPFIVKTATQEIKVLGTQFNVHAYEEATSVKTTLIEGDVKVSSTATAESKVLKPGQQAQVNRSGNIRLTDNIDTEEIIAWKNGMFYFNNTELSEITGQLSRWYDVEIDIPDMPRKRFNGVLPRDVKLSQVLQMMEKTSGLKFKIEGRRISMHK